MMIKIVRPFWSYDVQKTEEWLSSMAEKGYELIKINRGTRCFIFQQSVPRTRTYRIMFDKIQVNSLSNGLLDAGWIKVLQSGKWYVMVNEGSVEHINTSPVREGIVKHNKMVMYFFASILFYLTVGAVFNFMVIGLIMLSQSGQFKFVDSPYWIFTYAGIVVSIALWALSLYSVIKINKTNKRLSGEYIQQRGFGEQGHGPIQGRLSKKEEKRLKRSGGLIVKWKIGWMYAPDQLEKWLEGMEEQGSNLYRVSKAGTKFYFMKGESRKVSYCADLQNSADQSYFNIHNDAGWNNVFTSNSSIQRWSLWSREYLEGEARPQIYSDKSHQLKLARRIVINYSCMFFPMTILYMLIIGANIQLMSHQSLDRMQIINMILFVIVIFSFGSHVCRTWLYYRRLSKLYK